MALFRILEQKNLRPDFHDGYAYFTLDNKAFYVDANNHDKEERICVIKKDYDPETETLDLG